MFEDEGVWNTINEHVSCEEFLRKFELKKNFTIRKNLLKFLGDIKKFGEFDTQMVYWMQKRIRKENIANLKRMRK